MQSSVGFRDISLTTGNQPEKTENTLDTGVIQGCMGKIAELVVLQSLFSYSFGYLKQTSKSDWYFLRRLHYSKSQFGHGV